MLNALASRGAARDKHLCAARNRYGRTSCAGRLLILDKGAIVADVPPTATLTTDMFEHVFNVRATIVAEPATGVPVCLPDVKARITR